MGFKDLFIEREEEKPDFGYVPDGGIDYSSVDINTEVPESDTLNFVDDVYQVNHLEDITKSIFKVEELAATLPSEMPKDIKRQTVLSIMSTVGLSPEGAVDDGVLRVQCLENSKDSIVGDLNSEIQSNNDTIESLKVQISELQKENSMKQAQIVSIKEVSSKEVDRIKGLIDFLGEEVK